MVTVYIPLLVLLAVMGAFLAIMPWLMRSRECFAVTVPSEAQDDPDIRAIKRRYGLVMGGSTAGALVAAIVTVASGHLEAAAMVCVVAMLALSVLSLGLMLWGRSRVQAVKRERGWRAVGSMASAVVGEGDVPRAISLWWELLNVPVVLITVAIGVLGYPSMPDQVPVHVGFNGEVTEWAEKGWGVVCFTPLLQVFMTACFAFAQWSITRSKKAIAPDMPVASAYAYGLFARAQSVCLVVLGVLLNLSFIAMQLAMVGVLPIMAAGCIVMAVALVAALGSVGVAVVYGQSGARLMARVKDGASLPSDDDRYWKLGLIYVNPNDSSLFVPARFGIGWTSNFGRPLSWVIIGVGALVIAAFAVAASLLL